jgi:septum formation protein
MIYLASASPRRRELLQQIGIKFELLLVVADESVLDHELPQDYVLRVARLKAHHGAQSAQNCWPVLAADTIVVVDKQILLKPENQQDAMSMLQKLSGRSHQVKTAIAVAYDDKISTEVVTTDVTFRQLGQSEIVDYWLSGEPVDKAGAYAIQGLGGKFVKSINGSYSAVVGLPLVETQQLLRQCHRANE